MKHFILGILVIALGHTVCAQDAPDSDSVTVDSISIDSLGTPVVADSLPVVAGPLPPLSADSIRMVFPDINIDTLSERQRGLVDFEARFSLRREEQRPAEVPAGFSFIDSLITYLAPERWNLRDDIDRSFYHDAGDYFKSDPAFLVLEPQVTPMRKTVQPYGLAGDRLSFLISGQRLTPFEHVVEPDGLRDLNDVPTALDSRVVILPGPVGALFGGGHAVATLLTRPKEPPTNMPRTSFLVDKGTFNYSYARARYSRRFLTGRSVDMSVGYRKSEGIRTGRADDAYHYTGDFYFPVGSTHGVRVVGQLYNRQGPYLIRPDLGGGKVYRDRFDRNLRVSLVSHSPKREMKQELGYRHLRQGSSLNLDYQARHDLTGHGFFTALELAHGSWMAKASLDANNLLYDDGFNQIDRNSGSLTLDFFRPSQAVRWGLHLQQGYVDGHSWLPAGTVVASFESELWYLMMSTGYSERAPSLYELHSRYREGDLYVDSDYADSGNPDLISEKQQLGSVEISVGSPEHRLTLAATGGRVLDGIDWVPQTNPGTGSTVFMPVNGELRFSTTTLSGRWQLSDFLAWKGGGGYHHVDYELFETRPYTPEYQAFTGAEFRLRWSRKLVDLFAYAELAYVGPYKGYVKDDLGDIAVVNIKLSFDMGSFRFHWISQNTLSKVFELCDYFHNPGRYNSYGFIWNFVD